MRAVISILIGVGILIVSYFVYMWYAAIKNKKPNEPDPTFIGTVQDIANGKKDWKPEFLNSILKGTSHGKSDDFMHPKQGQPFELSWSNINPIQHTLNWVNLVKWVFGKKK